MSKSLVAFDTDRVKEYVFATGTLKEMRGASALLDYLNRKEMVELVGGDLIYANGGGGLFIVDTEQANPVIQVVQRAYRQKTHTASITGVAVELPEQTNGDIGEQLKLIRYRLRAEKDNPNSPRLPLTHSLLHFCDSCGTQYAAIYSDDNMLCASCKAKRDMDEQVKKEIRLWAFGKHPSDKNRLWGRLIRGLSKQGYPVSGHERPEDFGKLGKLSSPAGYMALIYADGDSMGREIEQVIDKDEMQRFSDAVDNSLYQAVTGAIHKHLQPDSGTWPFDILLLGGDDLVMVTRSQSGIEVALHIVERFSELTEKSWGKRLNLSASVAIAHINYPIGSLLELAENGLKFAKLGAAKRRQRGEILDGGLINFLVVSSANHLDFGEYYKRTLKQEDKQDTLYRTQRPYTVAELCVLLEQIRKLRNCNVPHAKLEQLRAAIFKSRRQATVDAMMAVLRLRNKEQRDALLNISLRYAQGT